MVSKAQMKFVHVIQRYWPAQLSGSERAMALLCQALADTQSNKIKVVTSNVGPGEGFYDPRTERISPDHEVLNGVSVIRLPVAWWADSFCYVLDKLGWLTSPLLRIKAFGPHLIGLERVLRQEQPDLVHVAPMPMAHVWQTVNSCNRLNLPLVITPTMHFDDPRFDNVAIYDLLKKADGVIAHTKFEKIQLVERAVDSQKIAVIASSFLTNQDFMLGDSEKLRKKYRLGSGPIVLFLGSKSFDKGTVHLLASWPTVQAAVPDSQLIIAGSPTSSWQSKKLSVDLPNLTELDYIDERTKAELLSVTDLVCVPSRSESFGMIVLESWAKGKPVIGGSAGATRELIDEGKNGYTVDFGDLPDLQSKLITLLQNQDKRRQLGQSGLLKAKTFTAAEIVGQTLKLYQDAINSHQKKRPTV